MVGFGFNTSTTFDFNKDGKMDMIFTNGWENQNYSNYDSRFGFVKMRDYYYKNNPSNYIEYRANGGYPTSAFYYQADGTFKNGNKLFDMLKKIPENESKVIMADIGDGTKKKIWEVTKRYEQTEFNDDETCVGYAVDVFQESINKTFREYLVNYTYLTRILENYGFILATADDLNNLHSDIRASTGFFRDLFNNMNDDIKNTPSLKATYKEAPNMSDGERTISFLNRYFIYKKVRKVSDAEKVALSLQHKTVDEVMDEARGSVTAKKAVTKALAATAQASAAQATKPKIKINRIQKSKVVPEMSVITEEQPATAQASAAQQATAAQQASSVQQASAVQQEPPTVNRLKGTIKLAKIPKKKDSVL